MKVALITGAIKGIGFAAAHELARQGFHVLVAARDTERGEAAAQKIKADGFDADFLTLDATDPDSIQAAAREIGEEFGGLDVLINNAAINLDEGRSILDISADEFRQTFETNVWGPLQVLQAFWPLLQKSESPRVINVSSGLGRLFDMEHDMPAYSTSKTALNALTRQFAGLGEGKVSVNSINPGWVQTDMGGPNAHRTPEQGAAIIVKLATMEEPPTGQFLQDSGEIGW